MNRTRIALITAWIAALAAAVAVVTQMWWVAAITAVVALAAGILGVWWHGGRTRYASPRAAAKGIAPLTPASAPAAASASSDATQGPPVRQPATSEVQTVVDVLQNQAAEAVGAVATHLWLADPGSKSLRLVASAGPMAPSPAPAPLEGSTLGSALAGGQAVLQEQAASRSADSGASIWRYAVPLGGDGPRGVVAIDIPSDSEPDTAPLTRLTSALRGALHGALYLHVARFDNRTAHALLEAAEVLTRELGVDEVVEITLDRAVSISNATTGSVMLLDEADGTMRVVASRGLPLGVMSETIVSPGEGVAGWVLATGKPLLVEDLPGKPSPRRHGVRSAVSVPITDERGTIGVINVGSRTYPARSTDGRLEALEVLARQMATAIRNALASDIPPES